MARARHSHSDEDWGTNLKATAYALDATTIDLCLELFPCAKFIDLRGNIPSFITITNGKVHDLNFLDDVLPEADAFYIMVRAYDDFERLNRFDVEKAFFVVRAKSGTLYCRRCSREVDKTTGVRSDQSIVLTGVKTKASYPEELRRASYYDEKNARKLVLTFD
jgi:hypothetical protein